MTLNRQDIENRARLRTELRMVDCWGEVRFRVPTAAQVLKRFTQSQHGMPEDKIYLLQCTDVLMESETEPMYTEEEVDRLAELDGVLLEPLVAAVVDFYHEQEKKRDELSTGFGNTSGAPADCGTSTPSAIGCT